MADKSKKKSTDFGDIILETTVAEDSIVPWRITLTVKNGREYITINRMRKAKDGELKFGKGIWIPIDGDIAEEVILAAQAVLFEEEFVDLD